MNISYTVSEIWRMTDVIFIFHFGLFFTLLNSTLPPPPPLIAKTIPRNIIILQWCTKNYDQMMYGSCDMVHDGQTDGQTKK